jgi:hypothetical protein
MSTDLIFQEECYRKEKEYSAGRTVYVKDSDFLNQDEMAEETSGPP